MPNVKLYCYLLLIHCRPVAGILFGDLMGIDVVGGLLNIVNTLGEQGLVGLLVAIILVHLFTKE